MAEKGETAKQDKQAGRKKSGRKGPKKSKLILGCGIGCAGILALFVLFFMVVYFFFVIPQAEVARKNIQQALGERYPEWKSTGVFPKEHQELFDWLAATGQEESASVFKAAVCFAAVEAGQDGKIDQDDLEYAQIIKEFLIENPECTMIDSGQLFNVNPVLEDRVKAVISTYKSGGSGE